MKRTLGHGQGLDREKPPKARSQKHTQPDQVSAQRPRDRFIGVLDPSTGVTQKDVENDLLCKGNSFINEPDWPFENIAVFSLNRSAQRSRGGCRGSRRSDRAFDETIKSNRAKQAFTQIVDTGFFLTVEWDAEVSFASDGDPSFDNPPWFPSYEMAAL